MTTLKEFKMKIQSAGRETSGLLSDLKDFSMDEIRRFTGKNKSNWVKVPNPDSKKKGEKE